MQRLKLLIVDDEPGMGLAITRALQAYTVHLPDMDLNVSFDLSHALTGEEALEMIHASPPDILLLDHKLPGISGLDILARLSPDSDLLTVMITAYASLENAILATKRGAFDFLAKPFTPDELKSVVYKTTQHLLLQRQARQLKEEKRKVRFEFISVLAHELKSPLAAVEQYLDVLFDMLPDKDEKKIVGRCTMRIQGMRKLILDLLDLTHIESGQRHRQVESLDLDRLLSEVVEAMETMAREKEVKVTRSGEKLSSPFFGDRWEVETMLSNLLSNAIKYNKPDGRVEITMTEETTGVKIAFKDTGPGIAPEKIPTLFKEFSRIRNADTEGIQGSGLGLSIIKKIACLYQGDIKVASEPGRGSTFTLLIHSLNHGDLS